MTKKYLDLSTTSRRTFLGKSLAITGAALAPSVVRSNPTSPNDRIGVGFIGVGGMGTVHLGWFAQQPDVKVVAISDVDQRHLETAKSKVEGDCKTFKDYRELLKEPGIDAVVISTPDHWHALTGVAAAKAGKHIYCEKPLTNSVGEGRALCDAVKEAGVVLQTGSHERSNPGAGVAKRLIQEGRFGEIKRIHIHLPNEDPHLQQVVNLQTAPPPMDVPEGFDYDFWLAYTPKVYYTEKRCHFWWRFHTAYGGGEITDRGAHVIDLAQMILGLDDTGPVHFEAEGEASPSGFFDAFIRFNFKNRYENGMEMVGNNEGPRGVRFEGTEGSLFVAVHGAELTALPASLLDGVEVPPATPYDPHRREFLDAIKTGSSVVAPAEAGHRTATICHLNNIAMRLGRPFEWDPVAERASDAEANELLMPKMKEPWTLPS